MYVLKNVFGICQIGWFANFPIGPYNDLSNVTASGKTYKVYCKRCKLEPNIISVLSPFVFNQS